MLPIQTILHATDFSENSRAALPLAGALARDYHARLIVQHVLPTPTLVYGEGVLPVDSEQLEREARVSLENLQLPAGLARVERLCHEGNPVDEILRIARESAVDLIVLGTHGRTGLAR